MQKGIIKKGFSKNTWNKGKLQNRYRARWAMGKTGIGLDEHRAMRLDGYRARQSLVGLSAYCANSYIPQHTCILYNVLHMWDVGICTV